MFIKLSNDSVKKSNVVRVNIQHIVYYYSVMDNPETSYSTWVHIVGGERNLAVKETVEQIDQMIQDASRSSLAFAIDENGDIL